MGDFAENPVKRAGFERVVKRNGDGMQGRACMLEPDVASLLTDHGIAELLEGADQPVC